MVKLIKACDVDIRCIWITRTTRSFKCCGWVILFTKRSREKQKLSRTSSKFNGLTFKNMIVKLSLLFISLS